VSTNPSYSDNAAAIAVVGLAVFIATRWIDGRAHVERRLKGGAGGC
jgi:hypothetical protein